MFRCVPLGERLWLIWEPMVFQGIPESDYVFTVCGLEAGSTPIKATSWDQIKSIYRGW